MHAILYAVCGTILIVIGFSTASADAQHPLMKRQGIATFIEHMVDQHQFKRAYLEQTFARVSVLPEVLERMSKPAESLPWHRYRNIFLKSARIEQGVVFWRENQVDLRRAEETFGVPASVIVAIIGVETQYGQYKGKFRVIDALTTLALDYPKRSQFFTKELEQFFLLVKEEAFDPFALLGSYAGAMGKPQFIASSYRHYAIDFDNDGQRDLLQNNTDVIGSVASYLQKHGWQRGQSVAQPVVITGNQPHTLVKRGLKPKLTLAELQRHGVKLSTPLSAETRMTLIVLQQQEATDYWVGLPNFYAITRYNHSALYAMAVYQLATAIDEKMQ